MRIKRVLIISPYFPPSNAADMQRVRMSLPFFKDFGWQAEVVTVCADHSDLVKDPLLEQSLPNDITIHTVSAFPKKITSKLGLGSLALRALWFYKKKVNSLLASGGYDLIYFSTTQFPVCILGAYWKDKFNIPFVIDMQDPWHSDYYVDKPKHQRPAKYWFSYRLNKLMEPIAMKKVGGVISVSQSYIELLTSRYQRVSSIPSKVITFGYFEKDFEITQNNQDTIKLHFKKDDQFKHVVYVGRGGFDMQPAIRFLFQAFKELLVKDYTTFKNLRFHFIGTSYASAGKGKPTFLPIAEEFEVMDYVEETTNRISFYQSIKALQCADGLIIPGSNDPGYTASKIYPYILAKKPLLGIFQSSSSAFHIIKECKAGRVADINKNGQTIEIIKTFLSDLVNNNIKIAPDWKQFENYSAKSMTEKQCELFKAVLC